MILGGATFLLGARTKWLKFVWAGMAVLTTLLIVASPRSGSLPNRNLFAVFWVVAIIVLIVLYMKGARQRWGSKIAFVAIALVFCYWGFLRSPIQEPSRAAARKPRDLRVRMVRQSCDLQRCRQLQIRFAGTVFLKLIEHRIDSV